MLNYFKANVMYPAAERYLGRDIRSKLDQLKKFDKLTPTEKDHYQKHQLYKVVSTAKQCVPYYTHLFKKLNFNPELLLKSTEYLNEIPLLTKEILREQGSLMVNKNYNPTRLHLRKTNGSTGIVTEIYYDNSALDWSAGASLYASEISNRDLTKKEIHLMSENESHQNQTSPILNYVKRLCMNRSVVQTKYFDEKSLKSLLKQIKSERPYSIQGHPSTMYLLSIEAQKHGDEFKNLFSTFESTGESLDQMKVNIIEKTFNCKVYNRYGNAEFGVIAQSKNNFEDLSVLEYMCYAESHSLGNGLDELVITGLTNHAMPLIRYKTGDIGTVVRNNGTTIYNLNGRFHDTFKIKDKTYSSQFLKDLLESASSIYEFQIIQDSATDKFTLKIVPSPSCNKTIVETKIKNEFSNHLAVEWTDFNGLILKGWRDKFRYLIKI